MSRFGLGWIDIALIIASIALVGIGSWVLAAGLSPLGLE